MKVKLMAFFGDKETRQGFWVNVGHGEGTYKPGGGSGNRATARKKCNWTDHKVSWKSIVGVDVVSEADRPGTFSRSRNISCEPAD